MTLDEEASDGPHFGPFRSVRANVVEWLMTHREPSRRAMEAHLMCMQAELNLRAYRAVRNVAIREWHAQGGVKPVYIAARLKLGKSSVHNIINDEDG